jgi:hypothetical protein
MSPNGVVTRHVIMRAEAIAVGLIFHVSACAEYLPRIKLMVKKSFYDRLNDKHAILDVPKDHISLLIRGDPWSAIGTSDLEGSPPLLVMGTSPGSTIVIARMNSNLTDRLAGSSRPGGTGEEVATLNVEESYMSVVRNFISIVTRTPELFQLPVACGLYRKDRVPDINRPIDT